MKYLLIAVSLCFLYGCERDFNPDKDFGRGFVRKPVVNSLLTSGGEVDVSLYWSQRAGSKTPYETIDGAEVELRENGQTVFAGRSDALGKATTGVTARRGAVYDIAVRIEGWPEVTASTTIPGQSSLSASCRMKGDGFSHTYELVDVDGLDVFPGVRAVWLSLFNIYDGVEMAKYPGYLFTNCPFVDQVNAERDGMDAELKESNMGFGGCFLRIPRSGFGQIVPFTFSSGVWPVKETYDYEKDPYVPAKTSYLTHLAVYIITPSDDYDRYMRSVYKMGQGMHFNTPMQDAAESVYTNIKNGLGIFAGYDLNVVTLEMDNPFKP